MADYAALVRDMASAYGGGTFGWSSGQFEVTRTHNAGSYGWPWEYRHTWAVPAAAPTRDALIRRGLVEEIPKRYARTGEGEYRLSAAGLKLADETAQAATGFSTFDGETPSMLAWKAAHAKAEAERKASSQQTRTV